MEGGRKRSGNLKVGREAMVMSAQPAPGLWEVPLRASSPIGRCASHSLTCNDAQHDEETQETSRFQLAQYDSWCISEA